jgi:hypothetical protein
MSMISRLIVGILLVSAAVVFLAVPASAQAQLCHVDFPGIGTVTVKAHVTKTEPFPCPFLTVTAADGSPLLRVDFFGGEADGSRAVPLRFVIVSLPGLDAPWIVATAGSAGGSDSSFETTVVGLSGAQLRELLPLHVRTAVQGSVSVGRFGAEPKPGVVLFKEIWGKGEVHYCAHRYAVTRYDWTGSALQPGPTATTRDPCADWRAAAREFGYACERNFPELLVPELR